MPVYDCAAQGDRLLRRKENSSSAPWSLKDPQPTARPSYNSMDYEAADVADDHDVKNSGVYKTSRPGQSVNASGPGKSIKASGPGKSIKAS